MNFTYLFSLTICQLRYHTTTSPLFNYTLKELFDTVGARDVLGFIRDIGLYRLI